MKRSKSSLFLLVAAGMALTVAIGDASQAQPHQKIAIGISKSPKIDTICLGEPILLNVGITNITKENASLLTPRLDRFGITSIAFSIMAPGETQYVKVQSPIVHSGAQKSVPPPKSVPVTTLGPGEAVSLEFMLHYDFPTVKTRRWLFPKPGDYWVKASIRLLETVKAGETIVLQDGIPPATQEVQTSPVLIRVTDLEGVDVEAWRDLQRLPREFLLYEPDLYERDLHPDTATEVGGFVEKHAGSRFASFGQLFLAYSSLKTAVAEKDGEQVEKSITIGDALLRENKLPLALQPKLMKLLDDARSAQQSFGN